MADESEVIHRLSKGQRMDQTDALFRERLAADKLKNDLNIKRLKALRLEREALQPASPAEAVERPKKRRISSKRAWK